MDVTYQEKGWRFKMHEAAWKIDTVELGFVLIFPRFNLEIDISVLFRPFEK